MSNPKFFNHNSSVAKKLTSVVDPSLACKNMLVRYMPLSQLLKFIYEGALPLVPPSFFSDKLDGSLGPQDIKNLLRVSEAPNAKDLRPDVHARLKERTLARVSCWHRNSSESEAMWRLYGSSCDSVALVVNPESLYGQLSDRFTVGGIGYFGDIPMPDAIKDPLQLLFLKRDSYAWESEVRIISMVDKDTDRQSIDTMQLQSRFLSCYVLTGPLAYPDVTAEIERALKQADIWSIKIRASVQCQHYHQNRRAADDMFWDRVVGPGYR